jgi:hypothetical protein
MNDEIEKHQQPLSMRELLNKSLAELDKDTVNHLANIRQQSLQSMDQPPQPMEQEVSENKGATLISTWNSKKITAVSFGFALAASLALTVVIPTFVQHPAMEMHEDFTLYSDVDPDWLADMEIADTWGDE